MIGAISTDDEMTYVIHDLPIPDHHYLAAAKRKGVANQDGLKPYTTRNTLSAYSTLYGKLTWEIGPDIRNSDGAFQESFFLGAPLAIDKNLYVLDESPTITMRLRVFDTTKRKLGQPPLLEKSLAIGTILLGESAKYDVVRRTQPLHLAYAGDLLVCPTHGGYIVGVDRKKLTVLWKYRYREELALSPAQPFWQAASPVIHKDSIVFTAADAPDVHCIDFEGKKRWIARSPNTDLYLATVHEDIALVVGKTYCRALSMKNGNEVWKLETGLPAGVGVKDGATYYLPLKRDDGPTIWAIDLVKGTKARALKTPYPDALGNLILHRGMFVSQSVTHIAAFPLP
jgi:hypothetical protein